jgi:CBS domain-containing protein/ribosome-associated translation inhibitor RaiA
MRLRDIMRTRVVTIGPAETADAAWTRMRRQGIRHLVVMDGTRLAGVISERDLGGRAGGRLREGRAVRDLMSTRVASAGPETMLGDAAGRMREQLIGSLPVLEDDQLVGIVTATDVFDALGSEAVGSLSRVEQRLLRAPSSSKRLGGRRVVRHGSPTEGEMPREHSDTPRSQQRAPLAGRVPRPVKRTAGRTSAPETPANIRVIGLSLDQDDRAYIRRRLGEKLGKYADSIERVTVRLEDVNGPRGGVDQACRIKVVLSGLPSVVVERKAATLKPAVTGAVTAVERAVRRAVERRRTRPMRGTSGEEVTSVG